MSTDILTHPATIINTAFDDLDTYYLANSLTPTQLRREIHTAEIKAFLADTFQDDTFPWLDYIEVCRQALTCKSHAPQPQTIPTTQKPHVDIEALKARIDIVAIAESYTKLRKAGRNFTGRCPFHDDTEPSLTVYPDSQTWHCFGACNAGGDVISFVMQAEHTDFKGAVALLESGKWN